MINKLKYDNDIIDYYDLPENTNVVYYQNPKLFFKKYLEMINPTHIGILWGIRKQGDNKNTIRYGRIIIPSILLANYLYTNEFIVGLIFSIYVSLYILTFMSKVNKNVNWNTGWTW